MPYINKDFIEELKNNADIVAVIGKRIALKKSGANYLACCPFHQEKTPSFSVSSTKQLFKCFGCDVGGGVLQFIQQYDHLDFAQSVEQLASDMGIAVIYDKSGNTNNAQLSAELKRQKQLLFEVASYYERQLRTHPLKNGAIDYIKSRKISGEVAKRFALGFAPPNSNDLLTKFSQTQLQDLLELGVFGIDEKKPNHYYARLRNRIVFPIHNNKTEIIGFGGRALSARVKPKYWNSPESKIFIKNKELYGLYHAREYSKNIEHILVVEGYMDVISLHQNGITNVVATLGTATSTVHLSAISRISKVIIFCFDGDNAGKKAAWRALEIALPWLKKGVQLRFLFLPDGDDPDSLVQKIGKNKFNQLIDKSLSFSNYFFSHLQSQLKFNTLEGKTEFVELAIEYLAKMNYDLYRHTLIDELVKLSSRPLDQIQQLLNQARAKLSQSNYIEPDTTDDYANFGIDAHHTSIASTTNTTSTEQLTKPLLIAIHMLLHYPDIAKEKSLNNDTEKIIKDYHLGSVLLDIIHSIQLLDDLNKFNNNDLIAPFKDKSYFVQLQTCVDTTPIETDAKTRFFDSINAMEIEQIKLKINQLQPLLTNSKQAAATMQQLFIRLRTIKSALPIKK